MIARHTAAGFPSVGLCLGGGLFYNTFFNTVASQSGAFDDVFVAPNPGNAGLAAGIALEAGGRPHAGAVISPFLGPGYDPEEVKRTLDNCKLTYSSSPILTSSRLRRGSAPRTAGRMVSGPDGMGTSRTRQPQHPRKSPVAVRARQPERLPEARARRHRSYGFSVAEAEVAAVVRRAADLALHGIRLSLRATGTRFGMPYREGVTRLRVQTVPPTPCGRRASTRFIRRSPTRQSFRSWSTRPSTAFSEPIVCSPRDAVRVFFGTGLDMLVIDRFLVRK